MKEAADWLQKGRQCEAVLAKSKPFGIEERESECQASFREGGDRLRVCNGNYL